MSDGRRHTVAVDLDGVLASYDGWKGVFHIGNPLPGAVEFCNKLAERYRVVINTSRCNTLNEGRPADCTPDLLKKLVMDWLNRFGFKYDDVYTGQGKVIASAYVDDRAVECRPQDPGHASTSNCAQDEFDYALIKVDYLCGYTSTKEKDTDFTKDKSDE